MGVRVDVEVRARVSRCLEEITEDTFGCLFVVVSFMSFFMHFLRLVICVLCMFCCFPPLSGNMCEVFLLEGPLLQRWCPG